MKYRIRKVADVWALSFRGDFRAFEHTFAEIVKAMDYDRSHR